MALRARAPHAGLETGRCFSLEEPFFPGFSNSGCLWEANTPKVLVSTWTRLEGVPCPVDKQMGHQGGAGRALLRAGRDAASLGAAPVSNGRCVVVPCPPLIPGLVSLHQHVKEKPHY